LFRAANQEDFVVTDLQKSELACLVEAKSGFGELKKIVAFKP
jgi:hypothetical protein